MFAIVNHNNDIAEHWELSDRRGSPSTSPCSPPPGAVSMCRNIRTLFNYDPPATDEEVRASATQFVRKLSGFTKPSKANEEAFERAVVEVSGSARRLLDSLVTNASPKNREEEARKRRARFERRLAQGRSSGAP
jgi:hypothetical protein